MTAFFAMVWDPELSPASDHSNTIRRRIFDGPDTALPQINDPGFILLDLSRPAGVQEIIEIKPDQNRASGAVFGTLFPNAPAAGRSHPLSDFGPQASRAIISSGGAHLFENYWGRYIAFISNGTGMRILQDPTAALPCYYSVQAGVLLLFSHLELCSFLDLSTFSVDEDFVRMLLTYDKFLNGRTGLAGVHELLGGQCLITGPAAPRTTTLWDPRGVACSPIHLTDEAAAQCLQQHTDYVIHSWAGCFDDIVVSLSGGLDSSIVVDSLSRRDAGARLSAFHYLLASGDPAELDFARDAAASANCPLEVIETSPFADFPELEAYPPTVRPFREFLAPATGGHLTRPAAPERSAIFTGQGGDHLFRASRSATGFADFLRLRGVSLQAPEKLLETARLSGKSVSAVLRETLPLLFGATKPGATESGLKNRQTKLISDCSTGQAMISSLPDWARLPGPLPPGKFQQVSAMPHMIQCRSHRPDKGGRDIVNPLISQPLIELCLRLPSYQLSAEGRSRGLARRAFSKRLPASITQRTTKGRRRQRRRLARLKYRRAVMLRKR